MGMGGGGAGGAIGAHLHTNSAGQGGALDDTTLLNAVTLASRLDPPASLLSDVLTSSDTTTSTSLVASSLTVTTIDNDKNFHASCTGKVRTTSAGSTVTLSVSGGTLTNSLACNSHDTGNRSFFNGPQTVGIQTGQAVAVSWAVGAGTGEFMTNSTLTVFGV